MTTVEKAGRETLRFLFAEYLKAPTVIYSISPLLRRLKTDSIAVSDYLLDHGWIRERWIYPDDTVGCRITIKGIEEVDPSYVRNKLAQVIGGLIDAGGSKPLIEILEHRIEEYSIALDIVRQLEAMGLVILQHPKNSIVIEITQEGRSFFARHGRAFLTLMAY